MSRAVQLLNDAIREYNDADSMLRLAEIYEDGADGVERDMNKANELKARAEQIKQDEQHGSNNSGGQ